MTCFYEIWIDLNWVQGSGLALGAGRPLITLESLSLALVRSEELGVRSGGAAHKNMEASQSIDGGDARRSADKQVSRLGFPDIDRLTANDKDFSLTLEMSIRESLMSNA